MKFLKFKFLLLFIVFNFKVILCNNEDSSNESNEIEHYKNELEPLANLENKLDHDDEFINDLINEKAEEDKSTSLFALEWNEKMSDYEEDIMFTTKLYPSVPQFYYEELTEENYKNTIKGAFIVDDENDVKITMIVKQGDKTIFSATDSHRIFEFNINEIGVISIALISQRKTTVTFTISLGNNKLVTKEHLDFSHEKIKNINKYLKEYIIEKKSTEIKHVERNKRIFLN